MYFTTAILVAALFLGSAAAAGVAHNATSTETNNNMNITSGAPSLTQPVTQKVVSTGLAPQIAPPAKKNIQSIENPVESLPLGLPFYACKVSPSPYATFYFNPTPPIVATQIAPTGTTSFLSGGTFDNNGVWWACEEQDNQLKYLYD